MAENEDAQIEEDGGTAPKKRCRSLAVLGTMSDAGKTTITAGICRVLANHNLRVAPFKAQNMSNNAEPALLPSHDRRALLYRSFEEAVAGGGGGAIMAEEMLGKEGYGEIGTAQAMQAEACRLIPRVEMNPVLLKSGGKNEKGEYTCSVVVLGKQVATETYGELKSRTTALRSMVMESHAALADATDADAIILEGAGSCTELNLMDRDIVNLPLVRQLNCPWLLVANIDVGGVFAQVVGTKACVSERDWALCRGIVINKLRGEAKYFEPGPQMIEEMVGKPVFVVPFLYKLNLPEEDGLGIERRLAKEASLAATMSNHPLQRKRARVVVIAYPHTAITSDLVPLEADERFQVEWRQSSIPEPYPHTTAVILPGSRLTRLDLKWLKESGWGTFLRLQSNAGGHILGLCGGYQMLGRTIDDPESVEGTGETNGLSLLPTSTTIHAPESKIIKPRKATLLSTGVIVEGFELHCGKTVAVIDDNDAFEPLLKFDDGVGEETDGLTNGRVAGTYLHGILRSPNARVELLVPPDDRAALPAIDESELIIDPLDRLADHLEACGLTFDVLNGMLHQA